MSLPTTNNTTSANSSSMITEDLIARSMRTLVLQAPLHWVWAVVSSLAILIGILQLVTIAYWKPLRKMDQILIVALAAADIVKSMGFDALAIRQLVAVSMGMDDISTQRRCMYWVTACDIPLNTICFLINALSLDRLLALGVPVWYKDRKTTLKLAFLGCSILAGCLTAIWIFLGTSDTTLVASCVQPNAITATYRTLTQNLGTTSMVVCLVTNATTCVLLLARWHSARRMKKDMKSFKKSVELNALKTLLAVVGVYLLTTATSALFRVIQSALGAIFATNESKTSLVPLSITFELFRGVLDFPLYVILVKEYRNGFVAVILKRFVVASASQGTSVIKVKSLQMVAVEERVATNTVC